MLETSFVLIAKLAKLSGKAAFLKKSHTTLRQWLLLLHLWAKNSPITSAAEDLDVNHPSAFHLLREVCTTKLLQAPIQLGGPRCVVQIDRLYNTCR